MNIETAGSIQKLQFSDVKEVWSKFLWPQRQSQIEEISFIDENGAIDMSIRKFAVPVFLGVIKSDQLVAVTSYFQTKDNLWRLRGTWTHDEVRGKGFGRNLISAAVEAIRKNQTTGQIWTMSRAVSVNFYLKNHFRKGLLIDGYEFGPHVIMFRDLAINNHP